MLKNKILSSVGGEDKLYVDDVFSAYTYTGNGLTQTITNGIDLAGKGGLVWIKNRGGVSEQRLFDTARGIAAPPSPTYSLATNGTAAQLAYTNGFGVTSVTSNGFGFSTSGFDTNNSGQTYASWTFRKAPKFFDVVTYTGDGSAGKTIAHALGQVPGMIIVKRTDVAQGWMVYHRSLGNSAWLALETTGASIGPSANGWNNTDPTASAFTVGVNGNQSGGTFVAYLFAHDPSADGIIQCGSFTVPAGSTSIDIDLGCETQFVLFKPTAIISNWEIQDVSRNASNTSANTIRPNTSGAEDAPNTGSARIIPNAKGFTFFVNSAGYGNTTYIYLAIRRPNKPPTTGTEVYNAIARTGTGAAATVTGVGFAPDLHFARDRQGVNHSIFTDKLRGSSSQLRPQLTNPELAYTDEVTAFLNNGINLGSSATGAYSNWSSFSYINHFFKRAPGVFDVVCYTDISGTLTINHGLTVPPELIITKSRNGTAGWYVYAAPLGADKILELNTTAASSTNLTYWNNTTPTATSYQRVTGGGNNCVDYLFATLPGISKVGSYTGNGTTQTINCGFATGSRFILIKRTDSAGDWYVWDSVRGIISANDPHLSLNTTAAEVTTDDSVDPENSGFIVNQNTATNINVNAASYIFLAIA